MVNVGLAAAMCPVLRPVQTLPGHTSCPCRAAAPLPAQPGPARLSPHLLCNQCQGLSQAVQADDRGGVVVPARQGGARPASLGEARTAARAPQAQPGQAL